MNYTIKALSYLDESAVQALSAILIDAVTHGASVGFIEPMTTEKALQYWQHAAASFARQERLIWVAVDTQNKIIGTVTVVVNLPENQAHRGDLIKLLVHSGARQQGIGQALMKAAEQGAYEAGKTLLVLDTAGEEASRLYQRLQWRKAGMIPDYAMFPDHSLGATHYYYKILA